MRMLHGRRSLPCSLLALLLAILVSISSGPTMAEGTTVTIDEFMGGYKNDTLEFRDNTWHGGHFFLIPTNATVLEAELTVTGVEGPIPTDDRMDFTTNSVGTSLWASHNETTGINPPSLDPYNNTWSTINASEVTSVKKDDGSYWHTQTPSTPNNTSQEWPVQVYHFQYVDVTNLTEVEVVWNGRGECQANGSFKYQAEIYLFSHSREEWLPKTSYSSTWATDRWLNFTLEDDSMFISSNGSIDLAVIGPHANKTATLSDHGHLYTDYVGLVAKLDAGRTEYPEDVVMEINEHQYTLSTGPMTGSVVVGDNFGFKDHIQEDIDRQPGWANNTSISLSFSVGKRTYADVHISNLSVIYTTDGGVIPNLPPRWVGPSVVTVEEDSDWTTVLDLDAAFTDDHDQGDLVFEVEEISETWLQVKMGWAPGGNRTLEVKPMYDRYGDVNITLEATDLDGARTLSPTLLVFVSPVPDAPIIITPTLKMARERVPFRTTIEVKDPDLPDDVLDFADDSDLFDINATDGTIDWVPTPEDIGTHQCTITVTDLMGLSDTADLVIEVRNVNDPPNITSPSNVDAEENKRSRTRSSPRTRTSCTGTPSPTRRGPLTWTSRSTHRQA